jgi:hypothetical protein
MKMDHHCKSQGKSGPNEHGSGPTTTTTTTTITTKAATNRMAKKQSIRTQ